MKAKRKPTNLAAQMYESIAHLRALERKLAERGLFPQDLEDYREHGYSDIYACAAGDGFILDNTHAFIAPDGKRYHTRECAELEQLTNEEESN